MFVFDANPLLHAEAAPVTAGEASPVRGLRRLLTWCTAALSSRRRLQARQRALPRPPGYSWLLLRSPWRAEDLAELLAELPVREWRTPARRRYVTAAAT
jgi:hypothetical protein